MRFVTAIALLVSVSSAFAGEYVSRRMSFYQMPGTPGNVTFYNCDSARSMAEKHLKDLGAVNTQVRCTGGLDRWDWRWNMPVSITASFDAPVPVGNDGVMMVKLAGRDACDLNSQFLDQAIKLFPGATLVSRRVSCWNGRSDRWEYTVQLTH
jgi:hypothetical protein